MWENGGGGGEERCGWREGRGQALCQGLCAPSTLTPRGLRSGRGHPHVREEETEALGDEVTWPRKPGPTGRHSARTAARSRLRPPPGLTRSAPGFQQHSSLLTTHCDPSQVQMHQLTVVQLLPRITPVTHRPGVP